MARDASQVGNNGKGDAVGVAMDSILGFQNPGVDVLLEIRLTCASSGASYHHFSKHSFSKVIQLQ